MTLESTIPKPMNAQEIAMYEQFVTSKHHYDNFTWLIGGPMFVSAAALTAYIPNIPKDNTIQRLIVTLFVWVVLGGWFLIYTRNRKWAEALNEAMREAEREHGIDGVGLVLARFALTRQLRIKNTDKDGTAIGASAHKEQLEAQEKIVRIHGIPIHRVLLTLVLTIAVLAFLSAIFV